MKTRRRKNANPVRSRRRGVTLVEMLVTLAVLLLMMALVVQIFQAATTSMNAAQVYQRLDDDLRRLDSTIRSDLSGATAKFTPPVDPADDQGYFEYTENEFADNDGEDCDDTIRLTVKAPEDRPFIGRMWAKPPKVLLANGSVYQMSLADMTPAQQQFYFQSQPITVTSKHAEVIYFLRNGNLYRRVLLIAPELQSRILHSYSGFGAGNNLGFFPGSSGGTSVEGPITASNGVALRPGAFGGNPSGYQTSWQGVNDLSAHPSTRGTPLSNQFNSVILNRLGDVTDRHKRFSMPRFSDDFIGPDGVADDLNSDSVPDWYPTVSTRILEEFLNGANQTFGLYNPIIDDPDRAAFTNACTTLGDRFAFPYLFRGSYSRAQNLDNFPGNGWIHAPAPFASDGVNTYRIDQAQYLKYLNHNPLDLGDNLPAPTNSNETGSNNRQTFWGWPTWRETLAPEWNDPTYQVNQASPAFPNALLPHTYAEVTAGYVDPTGASGQQLLPPLLPAWRGPQFDPFTEGAGSSTGFFGGNSTTGLWGSASWEDDLILTNVRSFDVKAFEPALADYADLGWGDDQRITAAATSTIPGTTTLAAKNLGTGRDLPYIEGTWDVITNNYWGPNAYAFIHGRPWNVINETFAHEGRMPPRKADYRFDAQFGPQTYTNYNYNGNIGDDSNKTIRMRRIWDSWSTTYTKAIATGVVPGATANGFPYGPPLNPPINPSYPPPYPAPLRGIQIQVRVTDPTNQRIKVLTIRQDFTDKL